MSMHINKNKNYRTTAFKTNETADKRTTAWPFITKCVSLQLKNNNQRSFEIVLNIKFS